MMKYTVSLWFSSFLVAIIYFVPKLTISYSSQSLSSSTNYYTTISINIGTPSQSIDNILLDSINDDTWVFDSSTNITSTQTSFNTTKSTTFNAASGSFIYEIESTTTNGTLGTDNIQVSDVNVTQQTFGLANYDKTLFKQEAINGALSISKTSSFLTNMKNQDETDSSKVTIDISSSALYLGEYSGDYLNSTILSINTEIADLSNYWTFKFDSLDAGSTNLVSCSDSNPCYGVIDIASPYLLVGLGSSDLFSTFFKNVGGNGNCNETSLECSDSDAIADYISMTINNTQYYMDKTDFYYNSKLSIQSTDVPSSVTGKLIYFGRPFLQTISVALSIDNSTITFSYTDTSTSDTNTQKWTVAWIVLACVCAFALIFFGVYCYMNKIPPATRPNLEEQSLLHAPPQQGGPSQAQPVGAQPRLQQAPSNSQPIREVAQQIGTSSSNNNNNDTQPSDPDEIRRRRLQFLEQQEQQAQAEAQAQAEQDNQ